MLWIPASRYAVISSCALDTSCATRGHAERPQVHTSTSARESASVPRAKGQDHAELVLGAEILKTSFKNNNK